MFITLRTSPQNEAGGMEQVVRRNAGRGGASDRGRATGSTRRPACVACQTKKLRCTGSPRNCDRCRARMIECVPASNGRESRSAHSSQPSNTSSSRLAWQKMGDASSQPSDPSRDSAVSTTTSSDGVSTVSSGPPPQRAIAALEAPAGLEPLDDDNLFDCEFQFTRLDPGDPAWAAGLTTTTAAVVNVPDGLDMVPVDMDELGRNGSTNPLHKSPSPDAYDPISSYLSTAGGGAPLPHPNPKYPVPQGQPRTSGMPEPSLTTLTTLTTAQDLPSMLVLDTSTVSAPLSPTQSWALAGVPQPPNLTPNGSPQCACLSDLVRVVQQLDDDEFHITTMSLDQVLQLMKWLVFQCCKPLDCHRCLDLASIHTVRLILCDRLTEMFECIHLRIKRASAMLSAQLSDASTAPSAASSSPDSLSAPSLPSLHSAAPQPPAAAVGSGPPAAQLFCGTSGRAANTAACNPMMFSDDFRNQYSDEEQVHVIRVLIRLQIRNFQKLLLRLERTSQVAASHARQSKVKSMMARLAKASADIDGALRLVFQALSDLIR